MNLATNEKRSSGANAKLNVAKRTSNAAFCPEPWPIYEIHALNFFWTTHSSSFFTSDR